MIAVLHQGLLSGAALDVFEHESLLEDNPLCACKVGKSSINSTSKGVNNSGIITPHVAGTSALVLPEIVVLRKKNFLAFTNKQHLSFVVDVECGY